MRLIYNTIEIFELLDEGDRCNIADFDIHRATAYIIDRLYGKPCLFAKYDEWKSLLTMKKYNDFIYDLYFLVLDELERDERLDLEKKLPYITRIQTMLKLIKEKDGVAIIPQRIPNELTPSWFDEIRLYFHGLKRYKQRILATDYLIMEYSMTPEEATKVIEKLESSFTLFEEFCFYIKNNSFKQSFSCCLTINDIDFTAELISKKLSFSPLDSYLLLLELKDNPKETFEKYINGSLLPKHIMN